MGLLSLGTPLDWHESKKHNEHVRDNGITQLINIFRQHYNRDNDRFFWGDEVEYMLVDLDEQSKTAKLAIDKDFVLDDLNDETKSLPKAQENNVLFHPEYGRYMIEATPAKPYDGTRLEDYVYVEDNMIKRRELSTDELPKHIKPLTITAFPRMGCGTFTSPPAKPIGPASQSLFLPDEIINRHARFPTLTANIRKRKGHKVAMNLPMYPDKRTKLLDDSIPTNRQLFKSDKEPHIGASKPGHVYMDSMGFGMGSSCLQITMQCENIDQARYLYDALVPVAPILLSLTGAAPIFKGYLVDQDVRWNVICGAVDDRTFVEKSEEPYPNYHLFGGLDIDEKENLQVNNHSVNAYGDLQDLYTKDGKPIQRVPKSRYGSVDNYLGDHNYDTSYFKDAFNDLNAPINSKIYKRLINDKSGQFDKYLANHFAHLFIRDPLVIFSERINQDNKLSNDHFENLQSTNWQTLRFKPPALYESDTNGKIDFSDKPGWRVEFRPMEVQVTDFENAAFSSFITLLSRAILKFRPNFYIPISKVELNMTLAHRVDSVLNDKFWFKSMDSWNLDYHDFTGYDFTWFDRFLMEGNDVLEDGPVYLKGYASSASLAGMNGRTNGNGVANHTQMNGSIAKNKKGCEGKTVEDVNDVDDFGMDQRYTINEIINGDGKFPGLISLIIKLIATELVPESCQHCPNTKCAQTLIRLKFYLLLVSKRASGEIPTAAHWMRHKVLNNPNYEQDSKVSEAINYELMEDIDKLTQLSDKELVTEFFGDVISDYLLNHKAPSR
ncbi:Glutamate-cysteine ligase family protein [Candida parapsilosis]|uniref:Glutamate--cysteine ligase n=2 Tax=Candida parapsilosis TaxID=5480 RepID=G8BD49_CANPC|nr:uncharacterized protein CPAR2_208390 [Candida parapsilosis]KAF6054655.1 Glutamate-cysteine ligase family protein [Candida parapsilosis]KAF6056319.1 Glutamate-cysteine ligase family protein [Candida parapsilosis]KAF6059252.1 Glutamate-cysteine ligase family protein [Candida parapsilosis]KAF6068009.1 Glutamate-cysteine ligase family protein [Candida parapsilosis]KAI5905277.1 Glutamate--cysteine ligase [Candida parapsilosis]